MTFNLINTPWIPVLTREGDMRKISPRQILDPAIVVLDWTRPDFNLACLEFLIGVAYAACAPEDIDDWEDGTVMPEEYWNKALDRIAPAFNLTGEGPLFMQDPTELRDGDKLGTDALFIDAPGASGCKKNNDIFVPRNRYTDLSLEEAAMALFTLQTYTGGGGRGYRVGVRGGGPMTILLDPSTTLWEMIWANVPYGRRARCHEFPWMQPARDSSNENAAGMRTLGNRSVPEVELFFGLPRRLRLIEQDGRITGVLSCSNGTKYEACLHPLSNYYADNKGNLLSKKMSFQRLGYENWLGIAVPASGADPRCRAMTLRNLPERYPGEFVGVVVGGWDVDNSNGKGFTMSRTVIHPLDEDRQVLLRGMIEAAEIVGFRLRSGLKGVGGARYLDFAGVFYDRTQPDMIRLYADLSAGRSMVEIGEEWHRIIRATALEIFDEVAAPAIKTASDKILAALSAGRNGLGAQLARNHSRGAKICALLQLPQNEVLAA